MATHGRNLTRLAIYNETTYGTLVVGGRWDHLGGYPSVRDDVDDQNRRLRGTHRLAHLSIVNLKTMIRWASFGAFNSGWYAGVE